MPEAKKNVHDLKIWNRKQEREKKTNNKKLVRVRVDDP